MSQMCQYRQREAADLVILAVAAELRGLSFDCCRVTSCAAAKQKDDLMNDAEQQNTNTIPRRWATRREAMAHARVGATTLNQLMRDRRIHAKKLDGAKPSGKRQYSLTIDKSNSHSKRDACIACYARAKTRHENCFRVREGAKENCPLIHPKSAQFPTLLGASL
jgi:hypothetical protein